MLLQPVTSERKTEISERIPYKVRRCYSERSFPSFTHAAKALEIINTFYWLMQHSLCNYKSVFECVCVCVCVCVFKCGQAF